MNERYDIENGTHWRGTDLAGHETVVQWLDGDVWVLMTAPYESAAGGTAQMPISDPDGSGKIFYSWQELAARLKRYGYTKIEGRTITVVDAETNRTLSK